MHISFLSDWLPYLLDLVLGMDVLAREDLPFPQSLPEFQRIFLNDTACAAYLESARWNGGFACPSPSWTVGGENLADAKIYLGGGVFFRARASRDSRAVTSGGSSMRLAGCGIRRRQFGCSVVVPGRLGWSGSPSASSRGRSASSDEAVPIWATAASMTASGSRSCGRGPRAQPDCRRADHR